MTHHGSQLLVSVRSADEAEAALAGGADLIDIKEPDRGPLGPADASVIAAVMHTVAGRRPISAACGELISGIGAFRFPLTTNPSALKESGNDASAMLDRWPAFLKWGLAGCHPEHDWRGRLQQLDATTQKQGSQMVIAAYADWEPAQAPPLTDVIEFACRKHSVLLIDTWDKTAGRSLLAYLSRQQLAAICRRCHAEGIRLALAGSLNHADIQELLPLQPDWFAVRGAACRDGRHGRVCAERVGCLARLIHSPAPVASS